MSFTPYIHFPGTCEEAMTFYAEVFGGTELAFNRYSDAPQDAMPGPKSDAIMHSQFRLGDGLLMASDYPPGMEGPPQQSVSVSHMVSDPTEGQRLYDRLMEGGGAAAIPWGETFFSPGFGMLRDRFGTHWMIMTVARD